MGEGIGESGMEELHGTKMGLKKR